MVELISGVRFKLSYLHAGQKRPLGFQEVKAPRIFRKPAHKGGKVVKLMHWPPLLSRDIPGTHFC
jgi:hypothetical protein